jgi:hypothetical protein
MIRALCAVAAVVFPSVPRAIAAVVAATQSPGGEGAPTDPVEAPGSSLVDERITPRPPVPEVLISWHADRATTHLTDDHMAGVLAGWTKEQSR